MMQPAPLAGTATDIFLLMIISKLARCSPRPLRGRQHMCDYINSPAITRYSPHPSRGQQPTDIDGVDHKIESMQPAPLTGTATRFQEGNTLPMFLDATRTPRGDGNC